MLDASSIEPRFPPRRRPAPAYENDWFRIEELADGVICVARSSKLFDSAVAAKRACLPVVHGLDRLGRQGRGLLFDARCAVGVSDAEYEAWYRPHRVRMAEGFDRNALLVKTQVGSLQSRRLITTDGESRRWVIFRDEAMALRYLAGKMPSVRPGNLTITQGMGPRRPHLVMR